MSTCPRCSHPLQQERRFESDVHVCPSCKGLLVEQRRLIPVLGHLQRAVAADVSAETVVDAAPDPGPGLSCPLCGDEAAHFGYMGTRLVHLDRCRRCAVVWLDAEAALVAAMLAARTEKRRLSRSTQSEDRFAGMDRRFRSIRAARLVEHLLL